MDNLNGHFERRMGVEARHGEVDRGALSGLNSCT